MVTKRRIQKPIQMQIHEVQIYLGVGLLRRLASWLIFNPLHHELYLRTKFTISPYSNTVTQIVSKRRPSWAHLHMLTLETKYFA